MCYLLLPAGRDEGLDLLTPGREDGLNCILLLVVTSVIASSCCNYYFCYRLGIFVLYLLNYNCIISVTVSVIIFVVLCWSVLSISVILTFISIVPMLT